MLHGPSHLLAEILGRGLRRQSYELNEYRLLTDYAYVLGMRFGFTPKPVIDPVGAAQKRPGCLRCMKLDNSPASAQRS